MANIEALNQLRIKIAPHELKEIDPGQYVLKNLEKKTYIHISEDERSIFQLFDGIRTVSDILEICYEKKGTLPFKTIYNLVTTLHLKDFLQCDSPEVLDEIAGKGDEKVRGKVFSLIFGKFIPVKPLQFLTLLSPVFSFFCQPLIQAALCINFLIFLYTAPPEHRVNLFQVRGSYLNGILLAYVTFVLQLSLRSLFRMAATRAAGCEVNAVGLRILPGLVYLDVNTDDAVMAGRKKLAHVNITSLMASIVAVDIHGVAEVFANGPLPHSLHLVRFVSLVILFIFASPLFKSDLFLSLEALFKIQNLDRHAKSYLRKKFFSRMFSRGNVEEKNEKFLIVLSTLGLIWLFGGALLLANSVVDQAYFLVRDFQQVNFRDRIAMMLLFGNLIIPILVFVSYFVTMIFVNVYHASSQAGKRAKLQKNRKKGASDLAEDEALALFSQNPIFSQHPLEEQRDLAKLVKVNAYRAGESIIVQGEPGDAFYVILEGTVEVVLEEISGVEKHLDFLSEGDSFGEIALLENVTRTATVKAMTPVRVLRLEKEHFDHFVADSEEKRKRLTDWIRFYSKLHKSPLFHEMSPGQMLQIMEKVSKRPVRTGDVVIHEGETGDQFYIIVNGKYQVSRKKIGGDEIVASLGEGEYFGDIALLKGITRTASVKALSDGVLFALSSPDFLNVVRRNLQFGLHLESVAEERLAAVQKMKKGKEEK